MTKAIEKQIGGDHYSKYLIQPIEFITKNNIPFIEGCIIKYIIRWRDKNGIEDLDKCIHYIELLKEIKLNANTKWKVGHTLLTFEEILEELKKVEEIELIELLNVTSDEIVDHFLDHIEDNLDKFKRYVEDNREEMNSYE